MAFRRGPWRPRWQIILARPLVSAVGGFGLLELMGPRFLSDAYVWFPDGRIQRVSPSVNGIYYQPHIHPDGSHVVFYGNKMGPPRVWKADLVSGDVVPLTPPDSGARHPAFSWDGSQIAFASDRASGQEPERIERMHGYGVPPNGLAVNLFLMDTNGQNVRQVTFGMYQDQRPCFSPDGKTLVFVSNRGGGNASVVSTSRREFRSSASPITWVGIPPLFLDRWPMGIFLHRRQRETPDM